MHLTITCIVNEGYWSLPGLQRLLGHCQRWRDPDAAADKYQWLDMVVKREIPGRRKHIERASRLHMIVQIGRRESPQLALDADSISNTVSLLTQRVVTPHFLTIDHEP